MLTVAYIGFGNSVVRYHLPYVERRTDYINVKYIYRRAEDRETAEEQERETWYPDITFTTDIDEVMTDEEVNLIVINSPDAFHVAYTMQALEHGKNVLVEKPLALTSQEAKEVFAIAKEKGLLVMSNNNRRYDPDMRTLRQVIESGVLGDLVELESHYDYYRPGMEHNKRMGLLFGLQIHPIDQIIGQFGIPNRVHYDCRSIDNPGLADDYTDIDFYYDNGFKVIVKTSFFVKIKYPKFILHGKKGSFLVPDLGKISDEVHPPGPRVVSFDPYPEALAGTLSYIDDDGNEVNEKVPIVVGDYGIIYDNIRDVLAGKAEKIIKDEETVAVLEIIEAGVEAAKEAK
ncbi:MAG: Gfo/Idh/MocA family oxidoreductase [Turicibacter sp.]|nr:Gfo/Idh/MocA family oxidoreductase [Turicibacter sp.]